MLPSCAEAYTKEDEKILTNLQDIFTLFIDTEPPQLKIYSKKKIPLSTIITLLGDFGIETIDNVSYEAKGGHISWLLLQDDIAQIKKSEEILHTILREALLGQIPKRCKLYRLALLEQVGVEEILFLRIMVKYLAQLLHKREEALIKIFLTYHTLVATIARDFCHQERSDRQDLFKQIKNYEADHILRILQALTDHILKTNFFGQSEAKSFKFDIKAIKELLPSLEPNIEAFVYHPKFLGVHLRTDPISRGGIRWSDREDFREEIKSLMITQEAKNAIIVPHGAKGGIVTFQKVDKEEFKKLYSLYIEALLDLIDPSPEAGEDFYFVVAADKGTADMSDVANEIAIRRGYWLGDAFASGGKYGYNHKKLGVTAYGAWISAARHFIDRGIDIFNDSISVVGTGSMRGDVFGNGMLINPNIRLLGAISSHEIFIDPDPDPKVAYQERKRLFEAGLGWSGYDKKLISQGGGVFDREAKEIELSPQIKKLLGIKKSSVSGEELARALLKAKVDLFYIGGVGTYVKSSEESNLLIADKINEPVRVDAAQLRCYAVCEGGNLGFTQKGRVEYAKNGGHINLDSIDNSAGVDTSDHEVNLKIALNQALKEGKLTPKRRNEILQELTQSVLQKVFGNNHSQSLAITLDAIRSQSMLEEFLQTIDLLESRVEFFERHHYDIPKNKEFHNVLDGDGAIVRPILGILLSYSKIFLKNLLLTSRLVEDPFLEHYLYKYFPKVLYPSLEKEVLSHPLRDQIIATMIANLVIDNAGATFLADFEALGEEKFLLKVRSYLMLNVLLSVSKVKKEFYDKELELTTKLYPKLLEIERSLDFSLQWILRNSHRLNLEPFHILNYKRKIAQFLNFEENRSENFFKYIDLIKFILLAIYLKELKEYELEEVLELLMLIISTFKIDQLLQLLEAFVPKDPTGKEIQKQLIELVNFFVTTIAKDVVLYTRSNESLQEGFHNYLAEKMIDPTIFEQMLTQIKQAPTDLMRLTDLVHKLLLIAI